MMPETYRIERRARRPASLLATLGAFVLAGGLWFYLSAHILIVGGLVLLAIPALRDIVVNDSATLEIGPDMLAWRVGRRAETVSLSDIDHVKARTALDFSQRATVVGKDGRKLRIPGPCMPPGRRLDNELAARGVAVHRTLF